MISAFVGLTLGALMWPIMSDWVGYVALLLCLPFFGASTKPQENCCETCFPGLLYFSTSLL